MVCLLVKMERSIHLGFAHKMKNILNQTEDDINWTLDTGDANITSTFNFNLTTKEDLLVYVEYNYAIGGHYKVVATAYGGSINTSSTLDIAI